MVFALSPAEAINGVIDFTTKEGCKVYSGATKKLDEELYDCQPEGLYQFLKSVSIRAREYGWEDTQNHTGILHVPRDIEDERDYDNLLTNYGEVTLEHIREYEKMYINNEGRAAQDTNMLFKCLMASLSKEGKAKILIWEDQYTVDNKMSGVCLLKIIIRESHLDTNATTSDIRLKLSSLDEYIGTIGSDIVKFNGYVMLLISSLNARGHKTEDLMTNLFKGYLAASDKVFVEYMSKKKDDWEDDTTEYTTQSLMQIAANKFKNLKAKGNWNAPSESEEKILALEAEVKNLKRAAKAGGKTKATTKSHKVEGKGKGGKSPHQQGNNKPGWMGEKPPKADLHKSKKYNGRMWWYCGPETGGKCEGKWRCHEPAKCQGKDFKFPTAEKRNGDDKKEGERPNKKKLKLTKSLEAMAINAEDSDSE